MKKIGSEVQASADEVADRSLPSPEKPTSTVKDMPLRGQETREATGASAGLIKLRDDISALEALLQASESRLLDVDAKEVLCLLSSCRPSLRGAYPDVSEDFKAEHHTRVHSFADVTPAAPADDAGGSRRSFLVASFGQGKSRSAEHASSTIQSATWGSGNHKSQNGFEAVHIPAHDAHHIERPRQNLWCGTSETVLQPTVSPAAATEAIPSTKLAIPSLAGATHSEDNSICCQEDNILLEPSPIQSLLEADLAGFPSAASLPPQIRTNEPIWPPYQYTNLPTRYQPYGGDAYTTSGQGEQEDERHHGSRSGETNTISAAPNQYHSCRTVGTQNAPPWHSDSHCSSYAFSGTVPDMVATCAMPLRVAASANNETCDAFSSKTPCEDGPTRQLEGGEGTHTWIEETKREAVQPDTGVPTHILTNLTQPMRRRQFFDQSQEEFREQVSVGQSSEQHRVEISKRTDEPLRAPCSPEHTPCSFEFTHAQAGARKTKEALCQCLPPCRCARCQGSGPWQPPQRSTAAWCRTHALAAGCFQHSTLTGGNRQVSNLATSTKCRDATFRCQNDVTPLEDKHNFCKGPSTLSGTQWSGLSNSQNKYCLSSKVKPPAPPLLQEAESLLCLANTTSIRSDPDKFYHEFDPDHSNLEAEWLSVSPERLESLRKFGACVGTSSREDGSATAYQKKTRRHRELPAFAGNGTHCGPFRKSGTADTTLEQASSSGGHETRMNTSHPPLNMQVDLDNCLRSFGLSPDCQHVDSVALNRKPERSVGADPEAACSPGLQKAGPEDRRQSVICEEDTAAPPYVDSSHESEGTAGIESGNALNKGGPGGDKPHVAISPRVADVDIPQTQEDISRQTLCVELKEVQDMLLRLIDDGGVSAEKKGSDSDVLQSLPYSALDGIQKITSYSTEMRKTPTTEGAHGTRMTGSPSGRNTDSLYDESAGFTVSTASCSTSIAYTDGTLPLTLAQVTEKLQEDLRHLTCLQQAAADKHSGPPTSGTAKGPNGLQGPAEVSSRSSSDRKLNAGCTEQRVCSTTSIPEGISPRTSFGERNRLVRGRGYPTACTERAGRKEKTAPAAGEAPPLVFSKCSASPPRPARESRKTISRSITREKVNKVVPSLRLSHETRSELAASKASNSARGCPVQARTRQCPRDNNDKPNPRAYTNTQHPAVSLSQGRCAHTEHSSEGEGDSSAEDRIASDSSPVLQTHTGSQEKRASRKTALSRISRAVLPVSSEACRRESIDSPDSCCRCERVRGCKCMAVYQNRNQPHMVRRTNCSFSPSLKDDLARRHTGESQGQLCNFLSDTPVRSATTAPLASGKRNTPCEVFDQSGRRMLSREKGRTSEGGRRTIGSQCSRSCDQPTSPPRHTLQHCPKNPSGMGALLGEAYPLSLFPRGRQCRRQNCLNLSERCNVSLRRCSDSGSITRGFARQRPNCTAPLTVDASTCWSSPLSRIASGLTTSFCTGASCRRVHYVERTNSVSTAPSHRSTSFMKSPRSGRVAGRERSTSDTLGLCSTQSVRHPSFEHYSEACHVGSVDTRRRAGNFKVLPVYFDEGGMLNRKSALKEFPEPDAVPQDAVELGDLQLRSRQEFYRSRLIETVKAEPALMSMPKVQQSTSTTHICGYVGNTRQNRVSRGEKESHNLTSRTSLQKVAMCERAHAVLGCTRAKGEYGLVIEKFKRPESTICRTRTREPSTASGYAHDTSPGGEFKSHKNQKALTGRRCSRRIAGPRNASFDRISTSSHRFALRRVERDASAGSEGQRSPCVVVEGSRVQLGRASASPLVGRRPEQSQYPRVCTSGSTWAASSSSIRTRSLCVGMGSGQAVLPVSGQETTAPTSEDDRNARKSRGGQSFTKYSSNAELLNLPDRATAMSDSIEEHAIGEINTVEKNSLAGFKKKLEGDKKEVSDNLSISVAKSSAPIAKIPAPSSLDDYKPTSTVRCRSSSMRRDWAFAYSPENLKTLESSSTAKEENTVTFFPASSIRASVHASVKQRKSEEAEKFEDTSSQRDPPNSLVGLTSSETYKENTSTLSLPAKSSPLAKQAEGQHYGVNAVSKSLIASERLQNASELETTYWESSLSADRLSDGADSSTYESEKWLSEHPLTLPKATQEDCCLTHGSAKEASPHRLPLSTEKQSISLPTTVYQINCRADDTLCSQLTYVSDNEITNDSPSPECESDADKELLKDDHNRPARETNALPRTYCSKKDITRKEVSHIHMHRRADIEVVPETSRLLASTDGIVTTRRPILYRSAGRRASVERQYMPRSSVAKRLATVECSAGYVTNNFTPHERRKPPPVLHFNMTSPSVRKEDQLVLSKRHNYFLKYLAEHYGERATRKRSADSETSGGEKGRKSGKGHVNCLLRSSANRVCREDRALRSCAAAGSKDADEIQKADRCTGSKAFGGASNRAPIMRVLEYICLAGKLNVRKREKLLSCFEGPWQDIRIFIILLKDCGGASWDLRALYALHPRKGFVKVAQASPAPSRLEESMVKHLYRYDSGSKTLHLLEGARTLGPTIVAATLKSTHARNH